MPEATREFCTYFDRNYLTRGLALFASLKRHAGPVRLWVLCFDDETFAALTLLGDPAICAIRLADFEAADPELLIAKPTRSMIEYYFTCSPALPLYVLLQDPQIEVVTYVDADLLFFSDPGPTLANASRSITIVPHGFPERLRHLEVYGIYNVGLLSFRNDKQGRDCLERWRRQCIDWCFDRVEGAKFADQGYLNDWPQIFDRVAVIDVPTVGLAPWNFMRHEIVLEGPTPTIDGTPVVFFHFQGFKELVRGLYNLGLGPYGSMPRSVRAGIYGTYAAELLAARARLRAHGVRINRGEATRGSALPLKQLVRILISGDWMMAPRTLL